MFIVFSKQKNRAYNYKVTVERSDRVRLQFHGVGKKFLVPHDLAHLIVESKLNMTQGFWGCVADGALFSGITIIEGRQKSHAKLKSQQIIKQAHQQLRLAECLVGAFNKIFTAKVDLVQAQKRLAEISADIKPELSNSTILDVCSTFEAFKTNWQVVDVGESIELSWNQKSPNKSLKL